MERGNITFSSESIGSYVGSPFNRRKRSRNPRKDPENIPSLKLARQTAPARKVRPTGNPLLMSTIARTANSTANGLPMDSCSLKSIGLLMDNGMNENYCQNQYSEQKKRLTLRDTNCKSSATRRSDIPVNNQFFANIPNDNEAQPTGFKRARSFVNELLPQTRARPALVRGRRRRSKTWRIKSGFDAEEEEEYDEQQDDLVHMPGSVSPESVFDPPPVQQFQGTRRCPFPQQRGACDTRRMRIDDQEVPVSVDGGMDSQQMDHNYALMKNNMWLKQLHWMRVLRIQKQRALDDSSRLHAEKTYNHFVDEQQQRSCELLRQVHIDKLRRKSSMQICVSSS